VSPVIITAVAKKEHSADEHKKRVNILSFIFIEDRCLRRRDAAASEEHLADD
jgi:hypothetical protein